MPPQQLLLSWKDHNGALVSVFENLLKRNTLVDCTLAADGQYLKAHKVVLSACSSYFELLFSQESEKNPIVILKDVKFQELKAAVNFMYRGEVEVCEDRLAAFLEVADSLQIKGLGSDGKSQDFREKSPSLKGSKTAVPPKSHSRKEVTLTQSENTGESSITLDSDRNSNESSSHHHLPHRETSGSSPIPSTLAVGSSYSIASASTSCPVKAETNHDRDKVDNNPCSSPSVCTFPSGDTVPSDVNTVVKSEPVTDAYLDEKSDETERDFDDVTMMEDQEDWDDPNIESMGDDHASNQHDPGFPVTHMKTEESTPEHMAGAAPIEHISSEGGVWMQDDGGGGRGDGDGPAPQFASVFLNEHQPSPDPSPGLAPGPAPVPGPASGVAPSRQGFTPASSGRLGKSGRFQCSQCGYVTDKTDHWTRHQLVHSSEKPFKCTLCSFATKQPNTLNVHMRQHTGEKPYKCTYCPFSSSQSGALKIHVRKHTGEKPYKCTYCPFSARESRTLKMHMRKHTGEKPYVCTFCPYSTSHSSTLKVHMRKHTGEKPFKCTHCPFATSKSGTLKIHVRKHTGEKPFQCTYCPYSTSSSTCLRIHMRRHTGEKPHKCKICEYATTESGTLKRHMRTHSSNRPYLQQYFEDC